MSPAAPPGPNPYAAPRPVARYVFPGPRLSRLAMDPAMLSVCQAWWDGLPPPAKEQEFRTLAQQVDSDLALWVEEVNRLPEAQVSAVMDFVEGSDRPSRDATIALRVERARPRPRGFSAPLKTRSAGSPNLAAWLQMRL